MNEPEFRSVKTLLIIKYTQNTEFHWIHLRLKRNNNTLLSFSIKRDYPAVRGKGNEKAANQRERNKGSGQKILLMKLEKKLCLSYGICRLGIRTIIQILLICLYWLGYEGGESACV